MHQVLTFVFCLNKVDGIFNVKNQRLGTLFLSLSISLCLKEHLARKSGGRTSDCRWGYPDHLFNEREANITMLNKKVKADLHTQENIILCDGQGNRLLKRSGTTGAIVYREFTKSIPKWFGQLRWLDWMLHSSEALFVSAEWALTVRYRLSSLLSACCSYIFWIFDFFWWPLCSTRCPCVPCCWLSNVLQDPGHG